MKAFFPFFAIVAFVSMVSLACAFGGSGTQQPQNEPTQVTKPTKEKQRPPTVDPDAIEAPSSNAEPYFTETFDSNLDNYAYFNIGKGNENKMLLGPENGYLVFNLKDNNLWIYITYNPFTYKDVALELTADNRGKDNNTVSLLCRYNKDIGWYEFSIANNGSYWIYAYDATGVVRKGHNTIVNGVSTDVKQGTEINIYSASCVGDKLTLTINGVEVKTIKDAKFKFREGKVGFSISSFDATPIVVNVDSFTISEP